MMLYLFFIDVIFGQVKMLFFYNVLTIDLAFVDQIEYI